MNELLFSTFAQQSWLSVIIKEEEAFSSELFAVLLLNQSREKEIQRERVGGEG